MNAIVTARVPVEIKNQVDAQLKKLDSSPTELINAAYEYVLNKGELPCMQSKTANTQAKTKKLSAKKAAEVRKQWKARAVLPAANYDGNNFRELLNEAKEDYYARFA